MIRRFADPAELAEAAAEEFVALAALAITARDRFDVALSGGSTPKRLFQLLAARGANPTLWDRVHLWWGDERTVPPDHADSNYRMTREALIDPLELDAARVHRLRGEDDPATAAAAYATELEAALGTPPVFDLVLLGMGPDGHTASLFPKSPALAEPARSVVANAVDSPLTKGPTTRLTITFPVIAAARHVRFLVTGADKAATLKAVLEGPRDPQLYPSQSVANGDLVWMVDAAAAALL